MSNQGWSIRKCSVFTKTRNGFLERNTYEPENWHDLCHRPLGFFGKNLFFSSAAGILWLISSYVCNSGFFYDIKYHKKD